jgi:hypothetical protein
MSFYGVPLECMIRELNINLRLAIQNKGGVGIRQLRNIFDRMDTNNSGCLDSNEFEQALAAYG